VQLATTKAMSFLHDLYYAWRSLAKTPGFLIVAVLSLALGIGANTALFSLVYSALYKTLPVENADRLIIFNDPAAEGMAMGSSSGERGLMTWPEFQQLQSVTAVDGLFAVATMLPKMHVRFSGGEEDARGKLVSGAFFSVLGVHPAAGRFFDSSADRPFGSAAFVVLSDEYWTRRFGRDPSVVGKSMVIQKTAFDVIGVAPKGFTGETVGQNPDFWVPLAMQMQVAPGMDFLDPMPDPTMKVMWLHIFGRLRPGANLAQAQTQAQTQANAIFKASLAESYASLSADAKKNFMDQRLKLRPASNGASGMRGQFSESMFVIFAAVGVTLLIACANLSNLMLARSNARQREVTIRLALGASKFRIARQLFTEGLIVSLIGAALGLLLSQVVSPLLLLMASQGDDPIHLDVAIDWRVLLFTSAVAVLTTLICSLIPSIKAAQTSLMSTLREGGRGMTASRGKLTSGRLFVAAQVALSLLLLVGAGLFLRTLVNLENVNLGYQKDRLAMINVDATPAGYQPATRGLLFRNILDKLRATPGVKSATFSQNGLFSGSESGDGVLVEGYTSTGKDDKSSRFDLVGPGYFSSLGIPLLQGREVDDRDSVTSTTICVINRAFAQKFFAGRNPIGKHVTDTYGDSRTVFEIVGVVADSHDHSLRNKVDPRVFAAFLQGKFGPEMSRFAVYEVRMANNGGAALNQLKNAVLSVDRNLDVDTRFLVRSLDQQLSQERLIANLVALFGMLALGLAAIGIYGILAYGVSQRTNEIGVRIAIGAGTSDVVGMIARETIWMMAAGLTVGLVAAYFLTRLVQSKLFGVTATDPAVIMLSIGVLAIIGLIAATLPALRAAHIDPAIALRDE
jgi:predicted permease